MSFLLTNELRANSIQSSNINATSTVQADSVGAESSVIQNFEVKETYSDEVLNTVNLSTQNAVTTNLTGTVLTCDTLNVNDLNVPNYVITTLFANEISASSEAQITTYTPETHTNTGLTTAQKLTIAFSVIAVVAAVALTVLTVGAGAPSFVAIIGSASSLEFGAGAVFVANVTYVNAVSLYVASAAVDIAAMTIATSTLGIAGSLTAQAIADSEPTNPVLRPQAMNASYGKSFLSDIIFGTTAYTSATAAYVNFLLVQNQLNGSYALPRFLSYNPQLGFFDDSTNYGGVTAYLSICTNSPYNTLRYESTGNLAIYDSTASAPIWESGTQVSSLKYKKNIRKITGALDKLKNIDVVRYTLKNDENSLPRIGVIAQQVQQVLEEAVYGSEERGLRVRLERLVPLVLEGMKEVYIQQEHILAAL